MITALLVDDEPAALRVLENLLSKECPNISIIAKCDHVLEAVKTIKSKKPDLVFLDVEMPNYAGYEIVNFFDEVDFKIIFTTAYDQYAIKAFELSAIDYVLKPINRNRLVEAVQKAEIALQSKNDLSDYQNLLNSLKENTLNKIVISELGQKHVININDIVAIEAQGAYSNIFLTDKSKMFVSKNLGYFEETIPEENTFFRSHKSWLINLNCVQGFTKSEGKIQLNHGIEAKLSKYKMAEFQNTISNK